VNCCVAPLVIEEFAGVTAIDCKVAAVTVSPVDPTMDEEVAEMVDVPTAVPVARPVAVIVALAGFDEVHVAVLVKF
jgi:hypothetical protein